MSFMIRAAIWLAVAGVAGVWISPDASASAVKVRLPNGLYVTKNVVSLREARYKRLVRQKFDLSCGAASLATILRYYYQDRADESDIIEEMLERGDREKIAEKGFSLLDLKAYAEGKSYRAGGYKARLSSLRRLKIPGIVLLDSKKYKHFVVLKGIKEDRVYLGDPASGNRSMSIKTFEEAWNGVVFLVVSEERMRGVSEFTLEAALPAPTMSVMRVQGLAGGTFSLCRINGEF